VVKTKQVSDDERVSCIFPSDSVEAPEVYTIQAAIDSWMTLAFKLDRSPALILMQPVGLKAAEAAS
jgi:hypothetical protein